MPGINGVAAKKSAPRVFTAVIAPKKLFAGDPVSPLNG